MGRLRTGVRVIGIRPRLLIWFPNYGCYNTRGRTQYQARTRHGVQRERRTGRARVQILMGRCVVKVRALCSRTGLHALAMNLLRSLPSVDSSRVAVTGVSFGAEMSVTYAVLDPRVRVVVAQG